MKTIFEALKEQYGKYPLEHNLNIPDLLNCEICEENIAVGDKFYDGGWGKRAHEECVNPNII